MEFRIITREEWGAVHGDGVGQAQVPASEVYLHHSVTVAPDTVQPFDDDYDAIRQIEAIGASSFGADYGFPYTWAVTPAGLAFAGHNPAKMGAHTYGHNDTARAICLVGNYMQVRPTEAQMNAVAWLLRQAHADGWISTPQLTGGHRQVYATACPGDLGMEAIPTINQLAASGGSLAAVAPPPPTRYPEDDYMYIAWQYDKSNPNAVHYAILSGPMFIGLGSNGEIDHAIAMIKKGAPVQWVEKNTWDDLDSRSHYLCGIGR